MSQSSGTGSSDDMALPATFRKLVCSKLTQHFRDAVSIQTLPMLKPGPQDVLVRNRFTGINASDINKTAGRYNPADKPPFDIGFESVGEVVGVGSEVKHVKVGQGVCFMQNGTFSEYQVLPAKLAIPVPSVQPEHLGLLVSGMTADLSLRECGKIKEGETVLVTAAAGGTGQFAVQYAKQAGCHVIGTCSSDSKAEFLKSLGCDRPINYKTEDLGQVLKKEYPGGVDVVYECVGGDMFHTCLRSLAPRGRLIIIGFVSGYKESQIAAPTIKPNELMGLLAKSTSITGFFLFAFANQWQESFARQAALFAKGAVKVGVDLGKNSEKGAFKGVDGIMDALDYMYSGKSQGKLVVEVNEPLPSPGL
ncbi:prostaglandin reductase-3-like isoform X3 [Patiria miniata]|uniref:15-oxoprostaglandin 13-reductase n=1 Tax=Patiria miniata TaxID=46514 RepID=A0A913ZLR7_PATMI|nr:prostaglandin reductase-3-like isoform X3 [Patiria miniata]